MAKGHVYDDDADPSQREIFDPEIGLLQSAAVWYLLAIRFEARLGEYLLQCCEYVLVCACRGACMLQAGVEVVSEFVDSEAFTRACVVLELAEVRDGHPQVVISGLFIRSWGVRVPETFSDMHSWMSWRARSVGMPGM